MVKRFLQIHIRFIEIMHFVQVYVLFNLQPIRLTSLFP